VIFNILTKHQLAVAGTHVVVGASGFIGAMAYFGVLSPDQIVSATDDVKRIAADLEDLYTATAGLVGISITAYAAVKSGPLASLFRAAATIAADPSKMAKMEAASISDKANVVAITDKLPEVAGINTVPTTEGKALAMSVPSPTVAVIARTAVLIALMLWSGFAMAQTKPKNTLQLPIDPLHLNGTPMTGNASADLKALWTKIVTASLSDLNYASAMAAASKTPAGNTRKQCWDAIAAINQQANGAGVVDSTGKQLVKPDPSLFSDVESQAEILDALSPQGALFTSCAGFAEMAKMDVLQLVSAVVTGVAGFTAVVP
jgi:hypothetical protein